LFNRVMWPFLYLTLLGSMRKQQSIWHWRKAGSLLLLVRRCSWASGTQKGATS
jgi:hypothetical protein